MTQSTSNVREVTKPRADPGSWLRGRLLHECEVMATYALSSGVKMPDLVVQALALSMVQAIPEGASVIITDRSDSHPEIQRTGNDASQQHGPDDGLRQLALAHNYLVQLVAPATPRTIDYLNGHLQRPRGWGFLGKVPFVRRSMFAAMLFLLGFVLIRVTPYVNIIQGGSALELTGWPLLFNELFYVTAAGLGASFAVLFEVNQYTLKAAFDPSYEPFYWTRFALGLIAGVLLAEMAPEDPGKPLYHGVAKPTLALLGGFSASVVYRILVRLRNTLEAFILPGSGSNDDFTPQGRTLRGEQPDTGAQDRLKIVARLIALQKRLESGANPEQLKQEMNHLVAELMVADEDRQSTF